MKPRTWFLLIGLVTLFTVFSVLGFMRKTERDQLFELEQRMGRSARLLELNTSSFLNGTLSSPKYQLVLRSHQNASGSRIRLFNQNRELVADSFGLEGRPPQEQLQFRPEVQLAFEGEYGAYTRLSDETERSLALFVAIPVPGKEQPLGVIYLSHTTDEILQQLGVVRRAVNRGIMGLAIALFLGALLVTGQLRESLNRLKTLTTLVSATQTEDIPIEGRDQVAEIGENFNRLIASLREKIAQLEEEKSKTKLFLEDIAHELKTPITGLVGSVEILKEGISDPDTRDRMLRNLERESSRLSALTSQLLELQKLDYAEFQFTVFDLLSVAEVVVDSYQIVAQKGGVSLTINTEELTPAFGDAAKIQRVLENLVENAVRCTPAGGTVGLHLESLEDRVLIKIDDDGPGPPKATAFQRHHQGKIGKGSLGLGLSIASEILKKHEQTLNVEAREPRGSSFFFELRRS